MRGWALFEFELEGRGRGVGGRLLTFSTFRMGRLFEVGANSRLGAYSNKYGMRVSYSLGTGSTMRILVFMPG